MLSTATSTKPASLPKAPTNRSSSPFDMFDDLEGTSNNALHLASKAPSATKIQAAASTAGTDDDILGLLGQPVAVTKAPAQIIAPRPTRQKPADNTPSSASSSRPPSRPTAARTPSPPPHILGQVVSMGFSVQQARLALAATLGSEQPGQWNISGAMEILASDGAAHAARQRTEQDLPRRPFDDEREEDDEAYLRRQRDGRKARQESSNSRASGNRDQDRNGTVSPNQSTLDATANELLQQASVFGSSMLKSANAYWKTSRAQIQKAIDEKKLAIPIVSGPSSGRSSPSSARPRWMSEEVNEDDDSAHYKRSSKKSQAVPAESTDTVFKDFEDDDDNRGGQADIQQAHPSDRPSERSQQKQREIQGIPSLQLDQAAAERARHATSSQNGDMPRSATLLGVPQAEKRVYTSPNRRKVAASAPVSAVPPHSATPLASAKPKVSRPPRPRISATPSQLETSREYRTLGNEHFKLGRYGEAVEAYTKASDALPEGHVAQVAVLNNRANARLKIGEERQASTDATAVLNILCAPTDLAKVTREVWEVILHDFGTATQQDMQNEKFDAHDALGKALARRARGCEGCEKWRLAMLDWQMITELGDPAVVKSAGGMKVVSEGLHRCRKVVEGGNATKPPAANAPKRPPPARPPKAAVSTKPIHSDAVDKLRETNKKAEADEAERLLVKDAVDAKITEWKGGKENNLRALIASLDNVLWDELGWKKVGMHELITDSQLKVRYVRAISKVHPDKVSPSEAWLLDEPRLSIRCARLDPMYQLRDA